MKKVFNAFLILIMIYCLSSCSESTITSTPTSTTTTIITTTKEKVTVDNFIDKLMSQTASYSPSWNKESFKGKWNYIDGVFLKSIIDKYNKTNDKKYMDFAVRYVNYYIDSNGNFLNLKDDKPGYTTGELDTVCESRILFDLYNYTNDSRYINAINETYQELMNMPKCEGTNNFNHKNIYPDQIWLDSMYMYVPFLVRYANLNNDNTLYDLVKEQYKYIRDHMFDTDKKLYYHGMDTTKTIFWSDSNTGLSKNFWLRSIGWYIASLADMLEYYPKGDNYNYLKDIFKEAIDGILLYKDSDSNMFYQVVDKKGESRLISYHIYLEYLNKNYTADTTISNYLESSGSSLIAYSILKGYNLGVLDSNYKEIGENIFNGVVNHSFINGELNDICITAGLGPEYKPYRDGSVEYYLAEAVGSNDAKGVGPFIMAYIAI